MSAEVVFIGIATAAACAGAGLAARSRASLLWILFPIISASGLSVWFWNTKARSTIYGTEVVRPVQVPQDGYLSSDSCRSCHPGEYSSWHDSFHRTMTTVASPETVKGDFHGKSVQLDGKTYIPGREGDQYWIEMDDPVAPEDALPTKRVRKEVAMITGSHHMQVYWFPSGKSRALEQSPIVYWLDQDRWLPRRSSFLSPPGEEEPYLLGEWNQNCSRCHATHAKPEITTSTEMYTTAGQFGIACEACHTPGEEHARLNRNPLRRFQYHLSDKSDESVVNPAGIDPEIASHACAQCHSLWIETPRSMREWLIGGDPFRPGEDLRRYRSFLSMTDSNQVDSLSRRIPEYQQQWFWPDGVLRVTGREHTGMMESPCFKTEDKRRKMTCFSCHLMHPKHSTPEARARWARDQLKHDPATNQDCLQCHENIGDQIEDHTHHSPDSSGSRCVNCHQPHTTYGLMTAIRSHQITSPEIRPSAGSRPNACNQCHLDKPLAWTADHLRDWYDIKTPPLSESLRDTAASIVWMLQGDAVQRAIAAWSLGWNDARNASGVDWMPPHLIELMQDPYDTVRWMAWSSLSSINGDYAALNFDFVGSEEERETKIEKARDIWARAQDTAGEDRFHLLLNADNTIQRPQFDALLHLRDNTPITLQE